MGRFPKLLTSLFRDFRNSYNEGVDKVEIDIDKSLSDSSNALTKATNAETNSTDAKNTANSVQEQFNQVVVEGDSSVEAAQARVKADATSYPTLQARLNATDAELAQNAKVIGKTIDEFKIQVPESNDTGRIKRAIDFAVASGRHLALNLPSDKTYTISEKLTIDVNYISLWGSKTVIDASAITSGEAILVVGTIYPTYRNSLTAIYGIELIGTTGVNEATAGRTKDTIGIKFDGVGSAGPSHVRIDNTNIRGFGKGIQFNNHSYIINFYNCDVYWCGTDVEMPSGLVDYGERLTFFGCSFYNSDNLIKMHNPNGSMQFLGCSFDYQKYKAFHVTGGRITVIGGHIEARDDEDYWWYVENNGSILRLKGVEIVVSNTKGNTSNYELGYSNVNVELGGIEIDSCFMSLSNYKKHLLVAGDGRVTVRNLKTNKLDYKFITSKSNNLLRDGMFKDANALLDWTVESTNVPTIDTSTFYRSPSSLKISSPDGNPVTFNKKTPCVPNELVTTFLVVKTQNLVANTKSLFISRRYLDAKDNVLFDSSETINIDTDWKQYMFQDTKVAPPGTEKFQLRINTGAWNTNCAAWLADVYITKT